MFWKKVRWWNSLQYILLGALLLSAPLSAKDRLILLSVPQQNPVIQRLPNPNNPYTLPLEQVKDAKTVLDILNQSWLQKQDAILLNGQLTEIDPRNLKAFVDLKKKMLRCRELTINLNQVAPLESATVREMRKETE